MGATPQRQVTRDVPPATEPLSLAEAKLYLRVDGTSEDTVITDMMTAVREAAEAYLRRSLITQTWSITYDDYAPTCTPLAYGPVQDVLSVKAIDRAGGETIINSAIYSLNAARNQLRFESVVMGHRVKVSYDAGYGNAADVPEAIRQGMLLHLAGMYDNRLDLLEMPASSKALYHPYREVRLA